MTQIAIVVYPGFTALDFIGPYEVLHRLPDAEVRFVWHEPGPITADSGVLIVGATHSFAETPTPDVILVPGGMTTIEHARDEMLLDWVRSVHRTATWTTSVCSGSVILAAAGLLDGKRAASHWAALSMLKGLGAKPVGDERVVHEGQIVTSAGVSAGIDLALWLAGQIGGEHRHQLVPRRQRPGVVHGQEPVGVPVEGQPEVRAPGDDRHALARGGELRRNVAADRACADDCDVHRAIRTHPSGNNVDLTLIFVPQ